MSAGIVQALQAVSGLLWLGVAGLLLPSFLRVWRRTAEKIDAQRTVFFFIGLLQFGFSARWLIWPHTLPSMTDAELVAWAALYLFSLMIAGYVVVRHLQVERGQ